MNGCLRLIYVRLCISNCISNRFSTLYLFTTFSQNNSIFCLLNACEKFIEILIFFLIVPNQMFEKSLIRSNQLLYTYPVYSLFTVLLILHNSQPNLSVIKKCCLKTFLNITLTLVKNITVNKKKSTYN